MTYLICSSTIMWKQKQIVLKRDWLPVAKHLWSPIGSKTIDLIFFVVSLSWAGCRTMVSYMYNVFPIHKLNNNNTILQQLNNVIVRFSLISSHYVNTQTWYFWSSISQSNSADLLGGKGLQQLMSLVQMMVRECIYQTYSGSLGSSYVSTYDSDCYSWNHYIAQGQSPECSDGSCRYFVKTF